MDSKNIINSIRTGYLSCPSDEKFKSNDQLIIDLKSSVCGFQYEFYTSRGQSLSGSYRKNLDIEKISNNRNQLIINLDYSEHTNGSVNTTVFLKLFDVDVINVQSRGPQQMSYVERYKADHEIIRLTSPIFHFMTLSLPTHSPSSQPVNHVQASVDEVEIDKEDAIITPPPSPCQSPRSLIPLPRPTSPDPKI